MRQIEYTKDPANIFIPYHTGVITLTKRESERIKEEWEKYVALFGGNYAVFSQTDEVEIIDLKGGWKHGEANV